MGARIRMGDGHVATLRSRDDLTVAYLQPDVAWSEVRKQGEVATDVVGTARVHDDKGLRRAGRSREEQRIRKRHEVRRKRTQKR